MDNGVFILYGGVSIGVVVMEIIFYDFFFDFVGVLYDLGKLEGLVYFVVKFSEDLYFVDFNLKILWKMGVKRVDILDLLVD